MLFFVLNINKSCDIRANMGNEAGWIKLPDFRLEYKATVIETVWYWYKNRNIDQWNKIEIPKTNPHTCGPLIYNKGGRNIQWIKLNKWFLENLTAKC